jgi:glc operon protein GlcG
LRHNRLLGINAGHYGISVSQEALMKTIPGLFSACCGRTVVIVAVDDRGHGIVLERLDDAQVGSVEAGIGKARTATVFRRPSKVFEDRMREGRVAALALPGATPLQGGIQITVDGAVGAIGVSGNTPQEDEDIAKAGNAAAAAAIVGR